MNASHPGLNASVFYAPKIYAFHLMRPQIQMCPYCIRETQTIFGRITRDAIIETQSLRLYDEG